MGSATLCYCSYHVSQHVSSSCTERNNWSVTSSAEVWSENMRFKHTSSASFSFASVFKENIYWPCDFATMSSWTPLPQPENPSIMHRRYMVVQRILNGHRYSWISQIRENTESLRNDWLIHVSLNFHWTLRTQVVNNECPSHSGTRSCSVR
jgi:hypothetical protein